MSLLNLVDRNSYDFDYISLLAGSWLQVCAFIRILRMGSPRVNVGDHLSLRQVVGKRYSLPRCLIEDTRGCRA
jgi:hypothetical protein